MTRWAERSLASLGALAGLLGVALSAASAHGGSGASLETAARFLLLHAPVLILMAALIDRTLVGLRFGRFAGWTMAAGLALFCGDLSMRALAGVPLAPTAAPTGGLLLMLGWLALAVGLLRRP